MLQPTPPVVLRANAVKSQVSDIEAIKFKMEGKEEQIMDLKRQIKLKVSLPRSLVFLRIHVISYILPMEITVIMSSLTSQ